MRLWYFFFLIIGLLFGYIYFLYKTEKIIFLTSNEGVLNPLQGNDKQTLLEKRMINGVYIKDNKEINTIPIYLSDELFHAKTPENFFYDAFFQFFRYINIYEADNFVLAINHVAISNKKLIINMHMEKKKELSLSQEVNLVRSMYLTAKRILPYIENIYFYDDVGRFNFLHLLPYINKEIMEAQCDEPVYEALAEDSFLLKSFLVPLLEKTQGSVINDIFERNVFQSLPMPNLFFPKHNLYTDPWFKEVYTLAGANHAQISCYFSNFVQSAQPMIKVFYYPFLSDTDTVSLVDEIDRSIVKNKEIAFDIQRMKKISKMSNIPFVANIMPLKAIMNMPFDSIYIEISAKDRQEMQSIIQALIKK